jgi:hypothetical protein
VLLLQASPRACPIQLNYRLLLADAYLWDELAAYSSDIILSSYFT